MRCGRNPCRPSAPARRPSRRLHRRARRDDPDRNHRQRARFGRDARQPSAAPGRRDADGRGRRPRDEAAGPGAISRRRGEHEGAWRGYRLRRRRHQAGAARRRRSGDRNPARRHARRDDVAPGDALSRAVEVDSAAGPHRRTRHGRAAAPDNPLSPLLDAGYLEEAIRTPLRSRCSIRPSTICCARHYPRGMSFEVDGQPLAPARPAGSRPRHDPDPHGPQAAAVGDRDASAARASAPDDQQGIAISTFGKVIKRGWDWLGLAPASAWRVTRPGRGAGPRRLPDAQQERFHPQRPAGRRLPRLSQGDPGSRLAPAGRLGRFARRRERARAPCGSSAISSACSRISPTTFRCCARWWTAGAGGQKRLPLPGRGDEQVPGSLFANVAAGRRRRRIEQARGRLVTAEPAESRAGEDAASLPAPPRRRADAATARRRRCQRLDAAPAAAAPSAPSRVAVVRRAMD